MLLKYLLIAVAALGLVACVANKSSNTPVPQFHYHLDKDILLKHVQYISAEDKKGRKTGTAEANLVAKYIAEKLTEFGVSPLKTQNSLLHQFSFKRNFSTRQGENVVGKIKGTKHPNNFIVLTAHYDHIGTQGVSVFNGADDNASGVAALLEFARLLTVNPPEHSIILLFTDGEELNFKGAKAFAKQYKGILSNTVLNINVDMIGGDSRTKSLRYIYQRFYSVLPNDSKKGFKLLLQSSPINVKKGFDRATNIKNGTTSSWYLASDHAIFYKKKIPFIYYGVGTHRNYHKTTDTFKNLNKNMLWETSNTIYQHLRFLDQHIEKNS
ncbi:M28 family peptidase [Thalassotalea euphylliae]|uniref:M28 family peptidase n=1 Tax=Thalassotalea euphylliae TaxID=1655234 RepID=UPI00362BC828